MCNCKQNEFTLRPEFEFANRPVQYRSHHEQRSQAFPEVFDTSQLEFEVPGVDCGVIGPDQRYKVTNTTVDPFKFICKIEMTYPDGSQAWCTGTLVGPNKVLTAAHCLFDIFTSQSPKSIRVIPGKNGPGISKREEPFGYTFATRTDIPPEYKSVASLSSSQRLTAAKPFDYGVITLKEPIGNRIGYWRRISPKSDVLLLRNKVNTAGYPQDISPDNQIAVYDQNVGVSSENVDFLLDICHGQSGSPIWIRWQNYHVIVGIVTIQNDSYNGSRVNSGIRISPTILSNIKKWMMNK